MTKRLLKLYITMLVELALGFLCLRFVFIKQFSLAVCSLIMIWFINKKYFVCPTCGAPLNPRAVINEHTVCGKCDTYIATGEKLPKAVIERKVRRS